MTPLVVALGNELVVADAAAVRVVRQFASTHPHIDVLFAGTDLLRHSSALRARSPVVLVDVAEGLRHVCCFDHDVRRFDGRQIHAHHLSAVQALELMRWSDPELAATRFVWVLLPSTSESVERLEARGEMPQHGSLIGEAESTD